jgi:hypothetical protein
VGWIIQPLRPNPRVFRLLIQQEHQPLQGMGGDRGWRRSQSDAFGVLVMNEED